MITNQRTLFPEPAITVQSNQCLQGYKRKEQTFPLDPQGTIWLGLPLHKYISLSEPHCCCFHCSSIGFDNAFIFDIVIGGWVWRRQPLSPHSFSFLLDLLALCKDSVSMTNRHRIKESRTLSLVLTSFPFLVD
jgi:hypothetical protein